MAREMKEGIGDWSGNLDEEAQGLTMGNVNEGDEEIELIGVGEDRR